MQNWIIFVGGAGLGARIMYLLDPARGKKRRAMMRDRALRRARHSAHYLELSRKDLENRMTGAVARSRSRISQAVHPEAPLSADILRERIRSKLGRYVSHPHAIEIGVEGGRVLLRGPILAHEARPAVHAIYRIPGVREVVDRLEVHRKADIAKLQGGVRRPGERPDFLQDSWAPATRLLAGLAGSAALFISTTGRKESAAGRMAGILGATTLLRSFTNRGIHELLGFGRRRPMRMHKTINIRAPLEQVFIFWSDFRNFPKFMPDVYEVKVSDDGLRSYWKVAGPAGAPLSFESYVTQYEANRVLSWKTVRPSVIPNSGTVHFSEIDGGTRIDLEFAYLPPGGALAETAARLFGVDPKSRLDESLGQMKTLLEQGPSERQLRRML